MRRAERLDAMASRSLPSAGSRLQGFSGFHVALVLLVSGYAMTLTFAQQPAVPPPAQDAVTNAQLPSPAEEVRPEQRKSDDDRSTVFNPQQADPASPVFEKQPKQGKISGFDFVRDPLNADKPFESFDEIVKRESAAKAGVMQAQQSLLQQRYNLEPKLDPQVKMSRGKPVAVGPTARLQSGMTWDKLAQMTPDEIRLQALFPYPTLPHPLQVNGGQVFPRMQIHMFQRLERFDVEFDLPEAFLPEFPPAVFLNNRPELGDVSRGEVISINNYYRLFKGLLTPVQLDGLRLLLTPFPQEEFNPTDDRKTAEPSLGVTCLDCHVNGHTTGQFHLTPDMRPQERRFRLDTTSLRGIKESPPYLHDGRLLTLEDTVEFFNLVLELKLTAPEKQDVVAFMRQL
jgi:hypothetical protein